MFSFFRRSPPRVIPMPSIDEAKAQLVASASSLIEANRQGLQVSRVDYYADYRLCYLAYDNPPFFTERGYTMQAEHLINQLTNPLINSDMTLDEHIMVHFGSFAENIITELNENTPNAEREHTETMIGSTSTEEPLINEVRF